MARKCDSRIRGDQRRCTLPCKTPEGEAVDRQRRRVINKKSFKLCSSAEQLRVTETVKARQCSSAYEQTGYVRPSPRASDNAKLPQCARTRRNTVTPTGSEPYVVFKTLGTPYQVNCPPIAVERWGMLPNSRSYPTV